MADNDQATIRIMLWALNKVHIWKRTTNDKRSIKEIMTEAASEYVDRRKEEGIDA